MFLAGVLAKHETALICDLAETYGVLHYRELPARLVAALAAGLGENSRVHRALTGQKHSADTLLMAGAVDRLSLLLWLKTKDGRKGRHRPALLLDKLSGKEKKGGEYKTFTTGEEFEAYRAKILEGLQ